MAMFFQQPQPYDPNRNPEIPASFPTAPDVAMPASQQSRGGLFGGGFARALRSVGGGVRDAVLGGEQGRNPTIYDFILGGFGAPGGAMGHVAGIRDGARADRDRRALTTAFGASSGSDATSQINSMMQFLPPELRMQILMGRDTAAAEYAQQLAIARAKEDEWIDLTPEEMAERGFRGNVPGQMNRKTGQIVARQSPPSAGRSSASSAPDLPSGFQWED